MEKASLVEKLPIEQYHSTKGILSKSTLTTLLPPSCPRKFKYFHIDGGEQDETVSLRIGSAVHVLALEPKLFNEQFYVLPDGIIRNARHQKYKDQLAVAAGRSCLSKKEYDLILGMADSLRKDKASLVLLDSPGLIESSIFWQENGLSFKCRPDLMRNDGIIVDLKTAHSSSKEIFERNAWDKYYALSVALTCRGYKALYGKEPLDYMFLCIEPDRPHIIEAYSAFTPFDSSGVSYLDVGNSLLDKCIDIYKDSSTTGNWKKYNEKGITPIGVPFKGKRFIEFGEL